MATAPERAYEYHRDRTGLSSTIARVMNLDTPAHAKAIIDGLVTFDSDAMTMGTAVHQMLLRDDRIVVIDADSYRTKDAQHTRNIAQAEGRVPILRHKYDEAREIAQHVNGQILAHPANPTPFTKGTAEHVIRFQSNGADCQSMLDWLRDDHTIIDDLKTTGDASPRKFQRHIFNMGYDIQAAFYVRAVEVAYGVTPRYRWVVVETRPPYPVEIYTLTDRAMYAAQVKVDAAIALWNECTSSGVWPAYPMEVLEVDVPGWQADVADAWAEVDLEEVPF
jgi:hypothetical protein